MTYYGGDNSGEDGPGYQGPGYQGPGYQPQGGQYGPGASGFPPPPQYAYPPQAPIPGTNSLAIAALLVSLLSCGPVGLILGIISLNQIKASGEQGRGMALAGAIIGALSTLFWVFILVVFVGLASFGTDYNY